MCDDAISRRSFMMINSARDDYHDLVDGLQARGFRILWDYDADQYVESHDLTRIDQSTSMLREAFEWLEQQGVDIPFAEGNQRLHTWQEILEQMNLGCDYLNKILNNVLKQKIQCP
jgi:hypothetical protein